MGRMISPAVYLLLIALALVSCAHGQVTTSCTASMVSSVSPCMGFLTNSSSNTSSPTSDCCNSLRSLAGGGMNCLCLILTGAVPFNLPVNRTLAVGLPRACNMPGVPLQCKASSAPVPAPGPTSLAPSPAPQTSSTPTAPLAPEPTPSASAPEPETVPTLSPPSTSTTGTPTATNSGTSPTATGPSNSASVYTVTLSPPLLLSAIAFLTLKFH